MKMSVTTGKVGEVGCQLSWTGTRNEPETVGFTYRCQWWLTCEGRFAMAPGTICALADSLHQRNIL